MARQAKVIEDCVGSAPRCVIAVDGPRRARLWYEIGMASSDDELDDTEVRFQEGLQAAMSSGRRKPQAAAVYAFNISLTVIFATRV